MSKVSPATNQVATKSEATSPSESTDPSTQHYYQLRDFPQNILRLIAVLDIMRESLKGSRLVMWISCLFFCGLGSLLIYGSQMAIPWCSGLAQPLSLMSVIAYAVLFYLCKLFSSKRHINPSAFSRRRVFTVLPLLLIFLFFVFGIGGDAVLSVLDTSERTPDPMSDWMASFYLIATAMSWVFAMASFLSARRYKSVIPEQFELTFCRMLFENLLREIPSDLKCSLQWNPFPACWSQQTTQLKKTGRDATYDFIVRAKLPLGSMRSVSIVVAHRISQKGRRKFKGYKHKVKLICAVQDAALKPAHSSSLRSKVFHFFKSVPTEKELFQDNQLGFRTDALAPTQLEVVAKQGSVSISESLVKIKSISPRLEAAELLHPNIILWRIRALTRAVSEITSSAHAK